MGHPRWELAGRETGRGIYHRRWDIQDGNWQVGRREEVGLPRWELAGREAGRRREEEFTTGDGIFKMGTGR